MFGGIYFAGATFAGALGVTGPPPVTPPPDTTAAITIDGVDVKARVRMKGLTIHDILNDAPNTAAFVIEGDGPAVGQRVRITIDEGRRVLFAGEVQSVDQSFAPTPTHLAWAVAAIDDTARANRRRPFGTWVQTSATTIAQTITTTYAPDFSTAGIAGALPAVSIVFDGSDTFIAALTRLATAIGGYAKVEDSIVYLFQVDATAPPDPIDVDHPFLFEPAIRAVVDSSQLRTRVYGKGYGEAIQADVAAGETLIPIENGAQFPALGGSAIAGTTPDGAQSERLAFTGVALAGAGTLVGPGAGPAGAPRLGLAAGAGVDSGRHDVAVVFVTALGKSLAGPIASIDVGVLAPPATAPTAGPATPGTGPDQGVHDYAVAFVTAFGETTPSPISNAITTNAAVGATNPVEPTGPSGFVAGTTGGNLTPGQTYSYYFTYTTARGETIAPPFALTSTLTAAQNAVDVPLTVHPDARVTGRRIYRLTGGGNSSLSHLCATIPNNTATHHLDTVADASIAGNPPPPAVDTTADPGTAVQRIPLTNIPPGPVNVTARKLYRRFNGAGTFKLVTTLANNTATTFTDAVANSALGAAALGTATAIGNQIAVDGIPTGAGSVTGRELYMSPVGSPTRKRALVLADNTTTTATITTSDAQLAAAIGEPSADASGLQQPQGQVNAGATVLPVAAAATFRPAGGWVVLSGGQVVRYRGITGQTLTGIPAAGAGAIGTTVLYGSQAIPAPMLVGVTGLTVPLLKGSAIHLWVQRDDLLAQAEQRARASGDGVIEHLLVDMRRGLESLTARCDADLARFSRPLVTVTYATRDMKTRSGKTITVDLGSPRIQEAVTIQDVTITDIDQVPGLAPRYTVTASNVRFSLEDTLRRVIAGGLIVGGSS